MVLQASSEKTKSDGRESHGHEQQRVESILGLPDTASALAAPQRYTVVEEQAVDLTYHGAQYVHESEVRILLWCETVTACDRWGWELQVDGEVIQDGRAEHEDNRDEEAAEKNCGLDADEYRVERTVAFVVGSSLLVASNGEEREELVGEATAFWRLFDYVATSIRGVLEEEKTQQSTDGKKCDRPPELIGPLQSDVSNT